MTSDNTYTRAFSLVERKNTATNAMNRNPCKIPVVLLYNEQYYKYLLPGSMTLVYLISIFRHRAKLSASDGIFIMTESGVLMTGNTGLSEIYKDNKSEDSFLYLHVKKESMFGGKGLEKSYTNGYMAETLTSNINITFSKVKQNVDSQFLRVYGSSQKKNITLKLPKMRTPFGVQKDNFSTKPQYILDLSFQGNEELLGDFEALNKKIIDFVKAEVYQDKSIEEVTEMFVSPIKRGKGDFAPSLRVKIVPSKDSEKLNCDFFLSEKDANGKFPKVNMAEFGGDGYVTTLVPKGTYLESVIEAIALWVRKDTFGVSFKLHQAKVFPNEPEEELCDFDSDSDISDAEFLG